MNTEPITLTIPIPNEQRPYRYLMEFPEISIDVYRGADYDNIEEAEKHKATTSAYFDGGPAAFDGLDLACRVANLLEHDSHRENLKCRIRVGRSYVFENVSLDYATVCLSSMVQGTHL